jgi:alpha/beta superfamily hydrolase
MHLVRRFLIFLFAWSALADHATTAVAAPTMDRAREERWAREVVPSIVVGDPVYLATAASPKVLAILTVPAGAAAGGIVVVHGLGVHPDWGLIGGIRSALADAGYVTLSVQMPVLDANATRDDYAATLPEASERIASAVAYLRARGIAKIAIVSHSMGASMANAYLARQAVDAWAPIGMFGPFATPPKEPVLDIVAETEIAPVRETAPARVSTLPKDRCSRQITIAGADHYFDRQQKELVAAISAFLERAFGGRCAQG